MFTFSAETTGHEFPLNVTRVMDPNGSHTEKRGATISNICSILRQYKKEKTFLISNCCTEPNQKWAENSLICTRWVTVLMFYFVTHQYTKRMILLITDSFCLYIKSCFFQIDKKNSYQLLDFRQ